MIYIEKDNKTPLYTQIYQQIKKDILSGATEKGTILPGSRFLAKELGIGRNTINNAYSQLAVEGYIESKKGIGFVVLDALEDSASFETKYISKKPEEYLDSLTIRKYDYDFNFGNFPDNLFPATAWRRYINQILFSNEMKTVNHYQDKQGDLDLRRELKKFLKQSRGVNCNEHQIVIGCGLHYMLELICKLISIQNKKIAFEEPGYHGSRRVFLNNGFTLELINILENGLDIEALQKTDAGAVYVTPSHQFPLGTVLSLQNRKQLISWAANNKAYIIEDDYDSEFRYSSKPIPSLQSIDYDDCVIYIGTFSKSFSPALRVNYMILPNKLLNDFKELFSSYQSTVSWLTQKILYEYITDGKYERHLRKVRSIYKKRHDTLIQAINQCMGDKVIIHGRGAGLHIILEFIGGEDQDWLIKKAEEVGVKVYPTKPFWSDQSKYNKNTIFLGYSMLDEKQIIQGIELLNLAWFK